MKINDSTSCPVCHEVIYLQNISETTCGSIYGGSCDKCGIVIEIDGMSTKFYKKEIGDMTSNGYLIYLGKLQNN